MSLISIRPVLAAAAVAALCLAVSPRPVAAPNAEPFERLVARALNLSDTGANPARIDIVIERWSTIEESDSLHDSLMQASAHNKLDKLIETLHTLQHTHRRAGVMQVPGLLGSGARVRDRRSAIVQFARDIPTPSGRQVVVALAQPVALGEYDSLLELRREKPQPNFTLIDIRFGPDGKGIGKVADAGTVTYNPATRTIELANYGTQPVRLTDVTRQ